MTWHLSTPRKATTGTGRASNLFCHREPYHHKSSIPPPPKTLGILSFETAKTMFRLISLYKSLSNEEFTKLRNGALKSKGVVLLNSTDERFLLSLVCAEKLEDLNRAVNTVARLGQKCANDSLKRFHQTYAEMSVGIIDVGKNTEFASKTVEKLVEKMEKYVTATSNLHAALLSLTEMETSERKLNKWKKNTAPNPKLPCQKPNTNYFNEKITFQRKHVKHYRETSLWSQTFDQSVALMVRIVSVIYIQICTVFGPYVSYLPRLPKNVKSISSQKQTTHARIYPDNNYCLLQDRDKHKQQTTTSKSSSITRHPTKITTGQSRLKPKQIDNGNGDRCLINVRKSKRVSQLPSESTVGGAGLALRYANIILLAERYLHAPSNMNKEARAVLYDLLPGNLKETVRGKLWSRWCPLVKEGNDGQSLREMWRDALEEVMTWLAPIASDTVKWQQERHLEKQRFDTRPTVLLFQTLYFSDLEKTEAAIVEVLVGLSCILRQENKKLGRSRVAALSR